MTGVQTCALPILRAERMPLAEGAAAAVTVAMKAGAALLPLEEAPLYLWLSR